MRAGGEPGRTGSPRQPITLWRLLTWAYRIQMVQYETDRAYEHRQGGSFVERMLGFGSGGDTMRGCINGAGTTADDDAHIVNSFVQLLRPKARYLLIDTAAAGSPPDWNPEIPPLRVVPVRKGTGTLRMIYGKRHAPIGCMIDYEGMAPEEAGAIRARAREIYADWWLALRQLRLSMLPNPGLARWRLGGIGAEQQPWNASPLTNGGNSQINGKDYVRA